MSVRIAALATLAAGSLAISPLSSPTASADPAVTDFTLPQVVSTPGSYTGITAPEGACAGLFTLDGAAGGQALPDVGNEPPADPDNPEAATPSGAGSGARITVRIPMGPDTVVSGVIGQGGSGAGIGGLSDDGVTVPADKGGDGGTGGHRGGGGGGYSTLLIDGSLLALSGAGGGSGGGHNAWAGGGGTAGVINAGPGIAAGQDGQAGSDNGGSQADPGDGKPGAGTGATTSGPGLGGVYNNDPASTYNGFPGVARTGGNGGPDTNPDTGGGGGAGYFGGGGGASGSTAGVGVGGGGGGGASYLAPLPAGVTFSDAKSGIVPGPNDDPTTPALEDTQAPSSNGALSIAWEPCNYDLKVTKKVLTTMYEPGIPVRYEVTITNVGPQRMGLGDTVSMTDNMAAGATLGKLTTSAGTPLTCDVTPGTVMTTGALECSRPSGTGVRGLDVGESLTINYRKAFTGTSPVVNTVTVTDRGNQANNTAGATVAPAKPRLRLTKKADKTRVTRVGEKVHYKFRVRNTGNVALKKIRIKEGSFSGAGTLHPQCPKQSAKGLQPGELMICTATYTVHARDLRRGRIDNTATASGVTPGGRRIESAPSKVRIRAVQPPPKAPNTGARTVAV